MRISKFKQSITKSWFRSCWEDYKQRKRERERGQNDGSDEVERQRGGP